MMKHPYRIALALATLVLASCATTIDMPKGSSKGYTSARLVHRNPQMQAPATATEKQIHGMIQKSIANNFSANGMSYGKSGAQLTVAYMVIYQEPGMTASYDSYFGYGRSSEEIADVAHVRGALENKRPDYFQRAGILVDVIDSSNNKLIYRNFVAGDVVRNIASGTRAARIQQAVTEALNPFFGK